MSAFNDYFIGTLRDRYADFEGRASRSEYWYYSLFFILIIIAASSLAFALVDMGSSWGTGLLVLAFLPFIIPSLAVTIRRLHDIGRSGWWYLLSLVPFGSIILLVFSILESQPGSNQWGPNPHELDSDSVVDHLIEDFS